MMSHCASLEIIDQRCVVTEKKSEKNLEKKPRGVKNCENQRKMRANRGNAGFRKSWIFKDFLLWWIQIRDKYK